MDEVEKQKQIEQKRTRSFLAVIAKYYLAPLLMAVASLLIFGVFIVPNAEQFINSINKIQELQTEYDKNLETKARRERLQSSTNDQLGKLDIINAIIPQAQTAVVGFTEKIKQKARENNVTIGATVTGEIVQVSTANSGTRAGTGAGAGNVASQNQSKGLELVELPADFTAQGTLASVRSFLSSIYNGDDFIIIKSMELQKASATGSQLGAVYSRDEGNWTMELTLTKYQLRVPVGVSDADIRLSYFEIADTSKPQQAVLDFIQKNYADTTKPTAE